MKRINIIKWRKLKTTLIFVYGLDEEVQPTAGTPKATVIRYLKQSKASPTSMARSVNFSTQPFSIRHRNIIT